MALIPCVKLRQRTRGYVGVYRALLTALTAKHRGKCDELEVSCERVGAQPATTGPVSPSIVAATTGVARSSPRVRNRSR